VPVTRPAELSSRPPRTDRSGWIARYSPTHSGLTDSVGKPEVLAIDRWTSPSSTTIDMQDGPGGDVQRSEAGSQFQRIIGAQ